jgi:CheY-like chemotaxis protein
MSARILVVDDNPVNLKLTCEVLACEGYVVDRAHDAESAQQILNGVTPDLILMDIAMPGMDGLALTRRLRQNDRFKRVPVIAMTAFAMKGDDVKALQSGCDGYITKPIDTRTFPGTIAAILRGRSKDERATP